MSPLFSLANVTKGKLTSVLGVIIILASLVSVFYPGVNWSEAAAGMGVGLALLGLKDPPVAGSNGIVAVVLTSALVGCASYTRCLDKYGAQVAAPPVVEVSDSIKVPVKVTTPVDSLAASLDIDSLATVTTKDTIRLISAGGRAHVTMYKSSDGRKLETRVKVPPQVIHDTITKYVTLYGKCPPSYTLQPKKKLSWYEPFWECYRTLTAFASLLYLLIFGFSWLRRRH